NPLLGREVVNLFAWLIAQRIFQRHVGDAQAAIVGSILAQRELAIEGDVILRVLIIFHAYELRILVGNARRAFVEFCLIFLRPPVAQVALGTALAALVVKAVRERLANDRSSAAHV